MKTELKDNQKIEIEGRIYTYNAYYKRLVCKHHPEYNDRVRCPNCYSTYFKIGYNDGCYECVAYCDCGHSMVVYDG